MARLAKEGARQDKFEAWAKFTLGTMPLESIGRWLRRHYSFRPEAEEVLRTVDWMLNDFATAGYVEGDCDDASIFVAAVSLVLGYRVRLVAIRYRDPLEFEHVYAEVFDGRWVIVDLTVPEGTRYNVLERMVLDVA